MIGVKMSDAPATPIIELRDVRKRFTRVRRVRTLAELVFGLPRRLAEKRDADGLRPQEFFALRDLSLTVAKGECLGVIGANGSGKSTLLKLLFRILRPDTGSVHVRGRVGGLIELGAGFHPYLTGRENVFINGAILGMKQAEIRRKYDSIVDFAGMAEFMDMPVKDYSSGMFARLAFAIAAAAEPDVLLVDEVLAVGDTAFQIKCYDWMAQRRKQGTTVVQVSHDLYSMAACSRVLYLNGGRAMALGEPRPTIDRYLSDQNNVREVDHGARADDSGTAVADITRVEVLNPDGGVAETAAPGASLHFRLHYLLRQPLRDPVFALTLVYEDLRYPVQTPGWYLFHVYSGDAFLGRTLEGEGAADVRVSDLRLPVGRYRVKAYLCEGHGVNPVVVRDGIGKLEVVRPDWSTGRGLVDHAESWQLTDWSVARES